VNDRDKNYTVAKVTGRMEQVNANIARYLRALDQADREESDITEAKSGRLKEKIAGLHWQMRALKRMEQRVHDAADQQVSLTDPDARSRRNEFGRHSRLFRLSPEPRAADPAIRPMG
jgi:hypothetical protein